jgi:hypothetical protein
MQLLKILLASAAVGVILAAFRDLENQAWLAPARAGAGAGGPADDTEPVLGYDGMDQDTLLDWLSDAELDEDTLDRMHRYELANRGREPVLSAIEDRLE